MAWALSNNSGGSLQCNIDMTAAGNFTLSFNVDRREDNLYLLGDGSWGSNHVIIWNNASLEVRFQLSRVLLPFVAPLSVMQHFEVIRDGDDFSLYIDSEHQSTGTLTGSFDGAFNEILRSPSNTNSKGLLQDLDIIIDGVASYAFSANASDHSNTGSQPVLVDTIGGNNATGVGFATDGSAWIDLGGGGVVDGAVSFSLPNLAVNSSGAATLPQPIGNASFTVNKPLFSSVGSATLPQPVGAINLTLSAPSFIVSGSASLPQPVGSASFTIDAPTFSANGSATTTAPSGDITITINEPNFVVNGSASLPQPTGTVNTELSAPTFALTGSATIPTWSAIGNITLNKPLFSVTGSTTLPQPNGSVELSLTSPVFNVSGSVSGIVIINGTDSTITLEAKVNLLTLETKSNTITL